MEAKSANYYETLKVHPAAPLDLITAAYWNLAGAAQSQRENGESAGEELHELSKAYAVLTDASARAAHDASLGIAPQPAAPEIRRRRGPRLFGKRLRSGADPGCDYYEVIRVQPTAPSGIVDEGYAVMRTQYLRLVRLGSAPVELLDLLEEAYAVTSDPERRSEYDAARNGSHATSRPQEERAPAEKAKTKKKDDEHAEYVRITTAEPEPEHVPAPAAELQDVPLQEETTPGPSTLERLRSVLLTTARVSIAIGRALATLARVTVSVILFIPAAIIAFAEFMVALVRNLLDDSPRPALPAVRRVWPDEEEAVLARISQSAGAEVHLPSSGYATDGAVAHVIVESPGDVARFEVSRWPVSVGAHDGCDIVLPHVAPEQLRLLARDGKFVLYSLSESPPVIVNGDPVAWSEITTEDTVNLGPHTLKIEGGGQGHS